MVKKGARQTSLLSHTHQSTSVFFCDILHEYHSSNNKNWSSQNFFYQIRHYFENHPKLQVSPLNLIWFLLLYLACRIQQLRVLIFTIFLTNSNRFYKFCLFIYYFLSVYRNLIHNKFAKISIPNFWNWWLDPVSKVAYA